MPTTEKSLRVLIVDDHRDAADSLGLLAEELGSQVHVTYGGAQALAVATAFRADLMFVDLAMPDMDGCRLAKQFRQMPAFARTKLVAITGHADPGHKSLAMKSGFDAVLFKPIALADIQGFLASVAPVAAPDGPSSQPAAVLGRLEIERRLPIGDARRIRNKRKSKTLTQAESQQLFVRGSFGFKRSIWDGGRTRFMFTSSKTFWWFVFLAF